jgi:hypothetical protein
LQKEQQQAAAGGSSSSSTTTTTGQHSNCYSQEHDMQQPSCMYLHHVDLIALLCQLNRSKLEEAVPKSSSAYCTL